VRSRSNDGCLLSTSAACATAQCGPSSEVRLRSSPVVPVASPAPFRPAARVLELTSPQSPSPSPAAGRCIERPSARCYRLPGTERVLVGRISSASPHLAATKTGQEAGACPGKACPQPPPPPAGPNGGYRRSQARAGQRNTTGESERAESESQFSRNFRPEDSACSLFPQLGRQAWCISSLQACPR
jgi:hypothetical protein